jgi:hypothetical protein
MRHWPQTLFLDPAAIIRPVMSSPAHRMTVLQLRTSLDSYINVFLTGLFLWPLLRSNVLNVRVKRLAIRTLV